MLNIRHSFTVTCTVHNCRWHIVLYQMRNSLNLSSVCIFYSVPSLQSAFCTAWTKIVLLFFSASKGRSTDFHQGDSDWGWGRWIMYLMGGRNRCIGRYIGRYSIEYRPIYRSILDRVSVDTLSSIGRYSAVRYSAVQYGKCSTVDVLFSLHALFLFCSHLHALNEFQLNDCM